ncbi:MAG: hypothetical protein RIQ38_309 [Pseudomonadota bacterium]
MNHLQLQQAALPDLSESQISRLPKDQLAHFSNAVQQLNDWTLQIEGLANVALVVHKDDGRLRGQTGEGGIGHHGTGSSQLNPKEAADPARP